MSGGFSFGGKGDFSSKPEEEKSTGGSASAFGGPPPPPSGSGASPFGGAKVASTGGFSFGGAKETSKGAFSFKPKEEKSTVFGCGGPPPPPSGYGAALPSPSFPAGGFGGGSAGYGAPFFGSSGKAEEETESFKFTSKGFARVTEEVPEGVESMIDMVFAMDCTGSMGSYIESAKKSIEGIVDKVSAAEAADVRFGYVAYRDHKPQDSSFVTMCHDFTNNGVDMKKAIGTFGASGGGDGPEAVTAALNETLQYPWRQNAVKIVVLIADAPPHGVTPHGDGFPQGDPDGLDPIEIANKMAKEGIILYVVACEPSLSGYQNAHDLMEGLAKITEGKYLPLTGADLLPAVIVGGAREEVALQKLEQYIEENVARMEKENLSREEIDKKLKKTMEETKIQAQQVNITNIYGNYGQANIDITANAKNLAEARSSYVSLQQPQMQACAQSVAFGAAPAPVDKLLNRHHKRSFQP